jgi:signal peptidase II
MKGVSRAGALAYSLAIAVVIADQAAKAWVLHGLRLVTGESRPLFGPLDLTLVANRGVSFGLFQADAEWTRWALAAFSLVVAVALAFWARRARQLTVGAGVGLIMGGAVGNLIDRVRLGQVVDFIDAQKLHFPWVFNVADSAINIGIALLVIDGLISARRGAE